MARDPKIEQRLQRWAQAVTVGDGSGFPTMSVLHREWSPPAPGQSPTMKTAAASDVAETHRLISRLSLRMRNTLVVHYCLRLALAEQALRLECAERTVLSRVEEAHCQMNRLLTAPALQCSEVAGQCTTFCNMREDE